MDILTKLGVLDHEFRIILDRTKIDYDLDKEDLNRKKHGYSLQSAVHLLERLLLPTNSPALCAVSDSFVENGEIRHMHMGVDDAGHAVLMVTAMRANETVRVISLLRAHDDERAKFEELTGYPMYGS